MNSREELQSYVPAEQSEPLVLRDDLMDVVGRLGQVLPREVIWQLFSSSPSETGGKVVFPYFRVDSSLTIIQTYHHMLSDPEFRKKLTPEKIDKYYELASKQALEAITWVEVGFEGLENLAHSSASRNWTSGVGHFVTDEERAQGIITNGKNLYLKNLGLFVEYRDKQGITDDCFTEYGLEHLLNGFRTVETLHGR